MKRSVFVRMMLTFVVVMACASMAWGYSLSPMQIKAMDQIIAADDAPDFVPRAESIVKVGDNYYGLVSYPDASLANYLPSEVIKFDADLKEVARVKLQSEDGKKCLNAEKMIAVGTKLIISCYGGMQMADGVFSTIWEVDTSDLSAKQFYDATPLAAVFKTTFATVFTSEAPKYVHAYDIAAKSDGSAVYILFATIGGSYPDYTPYIMLYKTSLTALESGNIGTAFADTDKRFESLKGAYSCALAYDDSTDMLMLMGTGAGIVCLNGDLSAISNAIGTSDLNGDPQKIAIIEAEGSDPKALYTTTVSYSNGALRSIKFSKANLAAAPTIENDIVTDLGGGPAVYYFKKGSDGYAITQIYNWGDGKGDTLALRKTSALDTAVASSQGKTANIHGIAAGGDSIYVAAYSRIDDDGKEVNAGEFVRLDISGSSLVRGAKFVPAAPERNIKATAPKAPKSDDSNYASDVEAAENVNMFYSADDASLTIKNGAALTKASFDVTENGVALDLAVAKSIISADTSLIVTARGETLCDARALPTFKAEVEKGKTVVVGIELGGAQLLATSADNVKVAKIRADGTAKLLEKVNSKAELADGKYTIYDVQKKEYASDIDLSNSYILNVAIRDGGENDIDGAENESVLDPLTTFRVRTEESAAHSSSGSCDMGFGLIAAAGLAALALRRRSK